MNGISVNGHHDYPANGEAGPSTASGPSPANGHSALTPHPQQVHNDTIINHLYYTGFQSGAYADTIVHLPHNIQYRLHAILLSRSPYLAHLLSTSPQNGGQPRAIYVQLEHEPEVTMEGFAIALGYLYSAASMNAIHTGNARGALAAGCLLGGMPELCDYAYEACRQSITLDTITQWIDFVNGLIGPANSSAPTSGVSTPVSPVPPPPTSVFGPYAERMQDDVFDFLVVQLPAMLGVNPAAPAAEATALAQQQLPSGRDTLLQIFARVPFDLFKAAVESPGFAIGPDQARFKFAKDAIELRKTGAARGTGAEETVVLAFGGGGLSGSTVHVTRKMRKRPLWKVNS